MKNSIKGRTKEKKKEEREKEGVRKESKIMNQVDADWQGSSRLTARGRGDKE